MKKELQKIISITCAVLLLVVGVSPVALAKGVDAAKTGDVIAGGNNPESSYEKYLSDSGLSAVSKADEIVIAPEKFTSQTADVKVQSEYNGEKGVILWDSEKGEVTYTFTVAKAGLYCLDLTYLPLKGSGLDINIAVKLDNKVPFEGADNIYIRRMWIDSDKPRVDSVGNEYSSDQIEYGKFYTAPLRDVNGIVIDPYEFALTAGTHTLTIEMLSQGMAISEIKFSAPERPLTYAEYVKANSGKSDYTGAPIEIEGEKAVLKGSRSLVAKSDNGASEIYPASATASKLNYIGGSTWQSPCSELIWEFNAPQDGWYKIGFSFRQNTIINGTAYRTLKIDGKSPFAEAKNVEFEYDINWQFAEWKNDDGAYEIYLDKGDHTISLDVTMGESAAHYKVLKDVIFDIGQLYLDIIMITGESPDKNRDYDLFKQIPGFNDTLGDIKDRLDQLVIDTRKTSGQESNQYIAAYINASRVIGEMIDNPYTAQTYVSDFYTQYTSLGSWLAEMVKLPISLDQIQLAAPEGEFQDHSVGFFKKTWFGITRFFVSFMDEYSRLSVVEDKDKQLKIWINWGRDQAQVLNNLIQQSFTPQTGISVNLELTAASVIKGMLSNTQPDLTLHMNRADPVNYAMRGALYDLKQFPDYDQVVERFIDSGTVPYTYKGGVYALPDTQNFYLMFYRTDIFEDLGLKVPETWDEFLDAAAHINRNNMTVYLPYTQIAATTTVNSGIGGLNLFASILQQYGGKVYNNEQTACTLDTPTALNAFTFWTQMYTKYKVPTTQSFYNRFKVGTCPLGIEVYTQYTQISEAAPEIDGCWDIALVPGVKQADGTINRAVSGSGSGCGIINKSKHKEEAWEFLKWWTSADTQLAYNNNVESILGTISRTTTATVEAFERMSWEKEDLEILLEQRSKIEEVPEIPGSYYLTRSVDQAYWQVIEGTTNAKDALIYWGNIANNEITRKIKQYS